jgi:hypothetical protein
MTKKEQQELVELDDSIREPMTIGKVFAESGMFPDIKSQAQAAVKILAGRELGLSPFESMKNLYLVGGKLAIQSNALASLVKTNPKYDYKVATINNEECKIIFFEVVDGKKQEIGVSEFTIKDAAKAGIINKDNWKNFPRNMLFARALANGVRFYCPDAACGWHIQEEYEDLLPENRKNTITINADGEVINAGESKETQGLSEQDAERNTGIGGVAEDCA